MKSLFLGGLPPSTLIMRSRHHLLLRFGAQHFAVRNFPNCSDEHRNLGSLWNQLNWMVESLNVTSLENFKEFLPAAGVAELLLIVAHQLCWRRDLTTNYTDSFGCKTAVAQSALTGLRGFIIYEPFFSCVSLLILKPELSDLGGGGLDVKLVSVKRFARSLPG